ncbi:MAG: hypothetical protein LBS92_02645 [Candidatus Methanoplasma sp.]|nr:hypothetical protein [Candidatus Methanoplasma sp.]
MITHGILPTTLCDMIADRIPCGTKRGKPHRPDARRVCSMRKERKYNIILDPIRIGDEVCWIVSNIEPIS